MNFYETCSDMTQLSRDLLNDISQTKLFSMTTHNYYPSVTLGRSRNRWSLDRTSGVLLHSLHVGLISSMALINFPHLSHWSPLASSYIQSGHVPSTKRSAKNLKKRAQNVLIIPVLCEVWFSLFFNSAYNTIIYTAIPFW